MTLPLPTSFPNAQGLTPGISIDYKGADSANNTGQTDYFAYTSGYFSPTDLASPEP
jgi:hypothetical protein